MHNHDDKYPARLGFEPGTSRLQALVYMNEPSGPAVRLEALAAHFRRAFINGRPI